MRNPRHFLREADGHLSVAPNGCARVWPKQSFAQTYIEYCFWYHPIIIAAEDAELGTVFDMLKYFQPLPYGCPRFVELVKW